MTPTPLQRLSEIAEAARGIDWPDFDEHGDAMVVAGCWVVRFLCSPEAVEVLARAIADDEINWGHWSETMKAPFKRSVLRVLNTIAEQALKEPSNG